MALAPTGQNDPKDWAAQKLVLARGPGSTINVDPGVRRDVKKQVGGRVLQHALRKWLAAALVKTPELPRP